MGRTTTRRALTAATALLLALGVWLAAGVVELRHDIPDQPAPVWTPIPRHTEGGLSA